MTQTWFDPSLIMPDSILHEDSIDYAEVNKGKPTSEKATHHQYDRVGWQESSPQNNFRRIIAAFIPKNQFCNHKINYIPESHSRLSLNVLLALLNSKMLDWCFRLGSTNAAVSHYQIYNLPVPDTANPVVDSNVDQLISKDKWTECREYLKTLIGEGGGMPPPVSYGLVELSRKIQEIEACRVLKNRQERSRLDPRSQPIQDVIDSVLFKCYGMSEEDGDYITKRLREML